MNRLLATPVFANTAKATLVALRDVTKGSSFNASGTELKTFSSSLTFKMQ